MNGKVATLPTQLALEAAWERYVAIVAAMETAPALRANRDHINAAIEAHRDYANLYRAWLDRQ